MLSEKVLDKIFTNEKVQKMPIETQSNIAKVVREVLEEVKEENPNGSISELFE